ncbi:receptor-like protein kinase THESEUS 1 [Hevea brasiliensis]|uniref:receptor-like protein kinase THESEUS 1 n=1 Tax=Hevea brasiliensis TaxID=3981 RepID=UPI0025D37817|nr:receptor-like protein kinase THESEUS 1 [Hevea brasiliensis]
MEKLQPCQILFILFPFLTIQFCFLILPSSGYTPPDKYFINCGSQSNASLGQRTFVGDLSYPDGSVKSSSQSENTSLYQTARVFNKSSSYRLHIYETGRKGNFSGLLCHGLHTTYRINVGGSNLTADNDRLWRNWIPDDDFLTYPETAKNSSFFSGQLPKGPQNTEYVAPDLVYRTAKELKQTNFSNITWGFNVSKNSHYLVRVHFCDIISTQHDALKFYFHIYSNFSANISSYDITRLLASPFYFDFVVESDNSGFINVSVHRLNDSELNDFATKNAILNGLEIMKMLKKSQKPKKKTQPIMVGSVSTLLFVVVLIIGLLVILKSRRTKSYRTSGRPFSMPLYGGSSYNWSSERTANVSIAPDLKLALKIPYVEIQRATKNFNSKLMIGEGGFGKVYKGILREGVQVAVKRSEPGHGQGILEFQTEIMVLSQIRHRHLVSLIGYCDERSEMILVYEFMEKGTLRDHLYISDADSEKSTSRSELSWEQRLKICIDSAKGLHYLHTSLATRIIHRDVKSTNILLNEDYIAKVADFGLSKSGPLDPDENTGVKGSFGYLDPEYFMCLQLTEKSDVYSFGVVLLEVLCARPAIMTTDRREEVNLAEWGMLWQKKGQLEKIIDPALVGTINSSSLRKFGETAEKCLRPNSVKRPMMHDVLWDLEFALRLQQTSKHTDIDDDSMNSAPMELAFQIVDHLPSHRVPAEEDDSFAGGDDSRVNG